MKSTCFCVWSHICWTLRIFCVAIMNVEAHAHVISLLLFDMTVPRSPWTPSCRPGIPTSLQTTKIIRILQWSPRRYQPLLDKQHIWLMYLASIYHNLNLSHSLIQHFQGLMPRPRPTIASESVALARDTSREKVCVHPQLHCYFGIIIWNVTTSSSFYNHL